MESTPLSSADFLKVFISDISTMQSQLGRAQEFQLPTPYVALYDDITTKQVEKVSDPSVPTPSFSLGEFVSALWHQRSKALEILDQNRLQIDNLRSLHPIGEGHPASKCGKNIEQLFVALKAENINTQAYVNASRLCQWSFVLCVGGSLVAFPFVVNGLYVRKWRRVFCLVIPIATSGALAHTSSNKARIATEEYKKQREAEHKYLGAVIKAVRQNEDYQAKINTPSLLLAKCEKSRSEFAKWWKSDVDVKEKEFLYRAIEAYRCCEQRLEQIASNDSDSFQKMKAVADFLEKFKAAYETRVQLRKSLGECKADLANDFPGAEETAIVQSISDQIALLRKRLDEDVLLFRPIFENTSIKAFGLSSGTKEDISELNGHFNNVEPLLDDLTNYSTIVDIATEVENLKLQISSAKEGLGPDMKLFFNWNLQLNTIKTFIQSTAQPVLQPLSRKMIELETMVAKCMNEVKEEMRQLEGNSSSHLRQAMLDNQQRISNDLKWCLVLKEFYCSIEALESSAAGQFLACTAEIKEQFPWVLLLEEDLKEKKKLCADKRTAIITVLQSNLLPNLDQLIAYLNQNSGHPRNPLFYSDNALTALARVQSLSEAFIDSDIKDFLSRSGTLLAECSYLQQLQKDLKSVRKEACFQQWAELFDLKINKRIERLGIWAQDNTEAEIMGIEAQTSRAEDQLHLDAITSVAAQFGLIDKATDPNKKQAGEDLKADLGRWLINLIVKSNPFPDGKVVIPIELMQRVKAHSHL